MINFAAAAGTLSAMHFLRAPAMPAPFALPVGILARHRANEPVVGRELHVMYHFIVPTEPFANVRMIASQTVAYAPGEGLTLAERQDAMTREAQGLRNQMLAEAELLRRDLTDRAFAIPPQTRPGRRLSSATA